MLAVVWLNVDIFDGIYFSASTLCM